MFILSFGYKSSESTFWSGALRAVVVLGTENGNWNFWTKVRFFTGKLAVNSEAIKNFLSGCVSTIVARFKKRNFEKCIVNHCIMF